MKYVFISLAFLLLCFSIIDSLKHGQQKSKQSLRINNIDTASFYWNAKDIRDISKLKSKYTSVVVADSFNYKAWSIDIQKYVAPFDTIDWCKMEILSYHKKR